MTSDDVPLGNIRQEFRWPDPKGLPAIVTTTPSYEASWSRDASALQCFI
jgi:hypothetical protein